MKNLSNQRVILNQYIGKRYTRFLEYANFHCKQSGMNGHGADLLHEVICNLLQKDENMLFDLLSKKKGGYTSLDFFILRMIKTNTTSRTAPYRHKNFTSATQSKIDANKDVYSLEIIDEYEELQINPNDLIIDKMNHLRAIYPSILTPDEKAVFEWLMFEDHTPKTLAEAGFKLHQIYNHKQSIVSKLKNHFNHTSSSL